MEESAHDPLAATDEAMAPVVLPALTIDNDQIDEACAILAEVLSSAGD